MSHWGGLRADRQIAAIVFVECEPLFAETDAAHALGIAVPILAFITSDAEFSQLLDVDHTLAFVGVQHEAGVAQTPFGR